MTEVKNTVEVVSNDSEKPAKVPFSSLTSKQKAKRISSIVGSVVQLLIVAFAIFLSVVVILSTWKQEPGKVSTDPIFGLGFLTVQTSSMDGSDEFYAEHPEWKGFAAGDLIVVKKFDHEKDTAKVGDVITVYMPAYEDSAIWIINTHRIIAIETKASGKVAYITQGDNNPTPDSREFVAADILCTWGGAKVGGFGTAMDWLKQPTPFLLCVVLPLALLFAVNLFFFIRALLKGKLDKQQKELQTQKAAAVQAAIDALMARQAVNGAPGLVADAPTTGDKVSESSAISDEDRQRIMEEERERARVYEAERARIREEELAKIREEARKAALEEARQAALEEARQAALEESNVGENVDENVDEKEVDDSIPHAPAKPKKKSTSTAKKTVKKSADDGNK